MDNYGCYLAKGAEVEEELGGRLDANTYDEAVSKYGLASDVSTSQQRLVGGDGSYRMAR